MQTPESAEYRGVTSIAPDRTSLTTPMSNFAPVHRWKSCSIDGQTTMHCSFLWVTLFMAAKRKVALRLGVRAGTVETSFNLIVYVLNSQTLYPSWRKYWVLLVCDTVRSVCLVNATAFVLLVSGMPSELSFRLYPRLTVSRVFLITTCAHRFVPFCLRLM